MSQNQASSVSVARTVADHRPAPRATDGLIPVWAIGETRAMTERERRLTAVVYAQVPGVLEHVRREGRLPREIALGGSGEREIGVRALVRRRGIDLELSEGERLVYQAIAGGADAPAGWVVVLSAR